MVTEAQEPQLQEAVHDHVKMYRTPSTMSIYPDLDEGKSTGMQFIAISSLVGK